MGRRQFGAVRRLPSGRYQARLPDGTAAPTTFTAKADAARWLATAEADMLRGPFFPHRLGADLPLGEWLDQWHTNHLLPKRPGTLARDPRHIPNHLTPHSDDFPLS